jgi:hypothetical protein
MRIGSVRAIAGGLLLVGLSLVGGCSSGKGSLTGTVSVKGNPLPAGTITVKSSNGTVSAGAVSNGSYRVDDVASGALKVSVVATLDNSVPTTDPKALRDPKYLKEKMERDAKEIAKRAVEKGLVIGDSYQDVEKSPLTWDTSKGWVFNIEIP